MDQRLLEARQADVETSREEEIAAIAFRSIFASTAP
jgi:hypothetical protein